MTGIMARQQCQNNQQTRNSRRGVQLYQNAKKSRENFVNRPPPVLNIMTFYSEVSLYNGYINPRVGVCGLVIGVN
ncbi:MAG: hypothetical protein WAO92_02585 [Bacteroidia bacterium]